MYRVWLAKKFRTNLYLISNCTLYLQMKKSSYQSDTQLFNKNQKQTK